MVGRPSVPSQIDRFLVLPLSLPPLPSFSTPAQHYLYVAPHEPKIPELSASRSLFLVNVPFDATSQHVKILFSSQIGLPAGRIEDVIFEGQESRKTSANDEGGGIEQKQKRGKKRKRVEEAIDFDEIPGAKLPSLWDREIRIQGLTAVVIFVDRASMDASLKAVKMVQRKQKLPVWGEGVGDQVPPLGYTRYMHHHELQYPDKSLLLRSVDKYMSAFAAKEARDAKMAAMQRQEPDADGFVTVTRGGRSNPARQELAKSMAEKQQAKRKGLEDFYRFQSREKKKEKAKELVRKFEEDKEKLRLMRDKRRSFKPE